MKGKKLLSLLFLSAAVVGCAGNENIEGTYRFSMGKPNSTSFAVSVDLSGEAYTAKSESLKSKNPKNFTGEANVTQASNGEENVDANALSSLFSELGSNNLQGYYYTQKDAKNQLQVCLGMDFIDSVLHWVEQHPEYGLTDLNPDVFSNVVYTTYEYKALNFKVPVSMEDLILQLTWYGFFADIQLEPFNIKHFRVLDFAKHPRADLTAQEEVALHVPTHKITEKDIEYMNTTFQGYFCNTLVEYEGSVVAGIYEVPEVVDGKVTGNQLRYISYYPEYQGQPLNGKEVKIYSSSDSTSFVTTTLTTNVDHQITSSTAEFTVEKSYTFRQIHCVSIGLMRV